MYVILQELKKWNILVLMTGRNYSMTLEELKAEVQGASLVLVGIGEEVSENREGFYEELAKLLKNKDYFVVTLQDREGLERAGLSSEQITAPLEEGESDESWEKYMHWLGFTLNQKLCVLELGAGFKRPEVIRFPFEKVSYFNQKSRYIRINERFPQLSAEIADRGISIKCDPAAFFAGDK